MKSMYKLYHFTVTLPVLSEIKFYRDNKIIKLMPVNCSITNVLSPNSTSET